MSNLLEFLTSKEIIIVYMISGLACAICFIIYLLEKNSESLRKKHNTRELNKLVEKIKKKFPEQQKEVIYDKPVLHKITTPNKPQSVDDLLENTGKINKVVENNYQTYTPEIKKQSKTIYEVVEEINNIEHEEPKYEEYNNIIEIDNQEENVIINDYEEEQEKTAIISLDELIKKGKEIYESNEISQYEDEGNEPISIQDLEKAMDKKAAEVDSQFVIENVVPKNELEMELKNIEKEEKNIIDNAPKKFQTSPIISPIFGIESINNIDQAELQLENTANYEKLDQEIKKTNEFLMTLQDLKENLE